MRTTRYLLPAWLAMVGLASSQDFGALSSCSQNCINNMRVSVGCVPVTDQCLCGNPNFENGIRDCANQACSAEDAKAAVDYAGAFCLKATGTTVAAPVTTPESTNTPPAPATTTAEPKTTAEAETTATKSTTASEPTSASVESATSVPETPTASTATTETSSTASTTASEVSETSSASSTSTSTSGTTATKASASQSASSTSEAAAPPPSESDLSVGAKTGIAVGAGAAVVALVALAIAYCRTRRSRRSLPRETMQISEPLPGSGRLDYGDHSKLTPLPPKSASSKFSGKTELDLNARRYEDMLPRVSPRRMV